ncbi:unnamed protein product, partial [Polarella glacialis]
QQQRPELETTGTRIHSHSGQPHPSQPLSLRETQRASPGIACPVAGLEFPERNNKNKNNHDNNHNNHKNDNSNNNNNNRRRRSVRVRDPQVRTTRYLIVVFLFL